jgi:hypothetical protein
MPALLATPAAAGHAGGELMTGIDATSGMRCGLVLSAMQGHSI